MLFSFPRVSAVLGMKVSDFYENGHRRWFRLLEKGGKHHKVPVHHKAQDYVAEYLEKARFEPNKPLFQTFNKTAADRPPHPVDPPTKAKPPEALNSLHFGDPYMLARVASEQTRVRTRNGN
jgi:integrase